MKKSRLLGLVLALPIIFTGTVINAALATNAFLNFDAGIPDPLWEDKPPTSGSYFWMQLRPDRRLYKTISQFEPIKLGVIQPASGSHTGLPNGAENPGIDNPWSIFSNTGMHQTSAPISIISDNNSGNVTLDFSGWGWTWNDIPFISLGGSPEFPKFFDTGIASMTCTSTCEIGDSFSLDYAAHIYDLPGNQASGFNGIEYTLHLEGAISTVPVPAAIWLFSSGLLGLIGTARKKAA